MRWWLAAASVGIGMIVGCITVSAGLGLTDAAWWGVVIPASLAWGLIAGWLVDK